MQAALDSTALWVSKDDAAGNLTAAQVTTKAQAYFNALYNNKGADNIAVTATYSNNNTLGQNIVLTGSGSIATQFMKLAGFPNMTFNTTSTAAWGMTRMRVALALDVTGSMQFDGKMDAMKKAAKSLVDTLNGLAKTADDVYISIIPFAQMVNVGVTNKNADWVKWDQFGACSGSSYVSRFASRSSCQANGGSWTSSSNKNYWTGCVIDRDQPADTTKDAPAANATNFPAAYSVQNGTDVCPAQILPMTSAYSNSNVTTLKNKINDLDPNGGTNQAIGMAWAWHSLQTGASLNTPSKDSNYQYTDAIILLSDGLNTIDRWYGNGSDPSPQVDARQKLLCDNIKTPETGKTAPIIYTIQVNTDGEAESAVLKYCANSGNFYPTTTASGIASAFTAIGTSLAKLRIAR
jgi:hypothetical protein